MTDNVVQSFCERCGARFTQAVAVDKPAPAGGMLGRFRRRASEPEDMPLDSAALPISEAFRDTFRFCLGCRRYNCQACWNEQEGHCLSCRPAGGSSGVATADAEDPGPAWAARPGDGPRVAAETGAWPTDDLVRDGSDATPAGRSPVAAGGSPATTDLTVSGWAAPRPDPPAEHPAVDPLTASRVRGDVPPADVPAGWSPASAPELPWTPTPEPDPWRGVVFSAGDVARVEPGPPMPPTPSEPAMAAAPDDGVSVLASLIDNEAHVDASGWVRASGAVMGLGGPAPAVEPDDLAPPHEEPAAPEVSTLDQLPQTDAWLDAARRALDDLAPEADVSEAAPIQAPDVPDGIADAALPTVPDRIADAAPSGFPEGVIDTATPMVAAPSADADASSADGDAPTADADAPTSTEIPVSSEISPAMLPGQPPRPEPPPERSTADLTPAVVVEPGVAAEPTPAEPPPPPPPAAPPLVVAPVAPSRQPVPQAPSPGLAVWATPVDPGPFAQPYQAPVPQSVVLMPDVPSAPPSEPRHPPGPPPSLPTPPPPPLRPGLVPPGAPSAPLGTPPLPAQTAPAGVPPAPAPPSRQAAASRACPSCNLPLSTKARFCRRCGAPQPS